MVRIARDASRGQMAVTLRETEARLLSVMPLESTIDRVLHARTIAEVVFQARRQATGRTRLQIARTRRHMLIRMELIRLLKDRIRNAQ